MKAYVSAPFRASTEEEVRQNVEHAREWANFIAKMGNHINLIVVHEEIIAKWGIPTANVYGGKIDHEITRYNFDRLLECDLMYVCGDRQTDGMKGEIKFAREHYISVVFLNSLWLNDAKMILNYS